MKSGHYHRAARELRRRLAAAIPRDVLARLHRKEPGRHALLALRQALLFSAAFAAAWAVPSPWVRVPAAIVLGLCVFDGTVLLHEVVHRTVFRTTRPLASRLLGLLYALPSGISPTQFTRWHLDHHAELGSEDDDPKRARLSPKRNTRWRKALYATPALFPIYFRAARLEAATYPAGVRRTIALERLAAIALHGATAAAVFWSGGLDRLVWLYLVPLLGVFPPAFALNRLGQHYDIDPRDPARWSTRMARSRLWSFVFLFSCYHLEHHYFPSVPFYRLPELNRALEPFYAAEGIPARTYRQLLHGWLVRNRPPHSDFSAPR